MVVASSPDEESPSSDSSDCRSSTMERRGPGDRVAGIWMRPWVLPQNPQQLLQTDDPRQPRSGAQPPALPSWPSVQTSGPCLAAGPQGPSITGARRPAPRGSRAPRPSPSQCPQERPQALRPPLGNPDRCSRPTVLPFLQRRPVPVPYRRHLGLYSCCQGNRGTQSPQLPWSCDSPSAGPLPNPMIGTQSVWASRTPSPSPHTDSRPDPTASPAPLEGFRPEWEEEGWKQFPQPTRRPASARGCCCVPQVA